MTIEMTETKTITMDTNFNNKLGCPMFIHLDLAPNNPVNERVMANTLVQIKTKDGSHPMVRCRLVDLARLPLSKVFDMVTRTSHGMTTMAFLDHLFGKYKNLSPSTEMAIYYYEKQPL